MVLCPLSIYDRLELLLHWDSYRKSPNLKWLRCGVSAICGPILASGFAHEAHPWVEEMADDPQISRLSRFHILKGWKIIRLSFIRYSIWSNWAESKSYFFCWEQASTMMFHMYIFTEWNGTSTTSFKDGWSVIMQLSRICWSLLWHLHSGMLPLPIIHELFIYTHCVAVLRCW